MAFAKSALTAREARLAASSITWIFSGSTGRLGSKNRIVRRLPTTCLNSMIASLPAVASPLMNSSPVNRLLTGKPRPWPSPSGGQHRDHHRRCIGAEEYAAILGERHARPRHLSLSAPAAKLLGQLDQLRASGRADWMPLRQQAAAGVDRYPAAERSRPRGQQGRALALPAQAELLVSDELGWGGRIMELDHVKVHDAAAPAELITYEELSLCGEGEGPALLASGSTALGGRIPVNPSGGLLSKGHPIGATGCAQLVELTQQLRGRCGQRQVAGARVALAQNGGVFLGTDAAAMVVTVLST